MHPKEVVNNKTYNYEYVWDIYYDLIYHHYMIGLAIKRKDDLNSSPWTILKENNNKVNE